MVQPGGQVHLSLPAVEAVHASEDEAEMLGVSLRQVLKIVVVGIEGAGSDLVQQRLPFGRFTRFRK